jgi:putative transposase
MVINKNNQSTSSNISSTSNTTVSFKILPDFNQGIMLEDSSVAYIDNINLLISEMVESKAKTKKSSKDVKANLNSSVKNQLIRDASSVFKKIKKSKFKIIPVLKKKVLVFNSQNYKVTDDYISIPFMIDGKSKRVKIKALASNPYIQDALNNGKLGTLRITKKSDKWIAQIAVTIDIELKDKTEGNILGVDLGIKVPAVGVTNTHKTKFFGNGYLNKHMRRKYQARRRSLGRAKKKKVLESSNHKEQQWMKNQDHKVSREIINFAINNNVSVIRLEHLKGISKTTRTSRKNRKDLHNWSFYRLMNFISYKAERVGISVEMVNPAYTSQICPSCKKKNKAKGRSYECDCCGFKTHRDRVGAINIISAPLVDGKASKA